MSDMVIVGRFGKVHGIKGDIRVQSFTDPPGNIVDYLPWQIRSSSKSEWRVVDISQTYWQGDQLVVHVRDTNDRDDAKRYTNQEIGIARSQLPELTEENEYYWSDLIGLTVINTKGVTLGTVDSFFETGANDIMVVKGEREYLVPYTKYAILNVELTTRTINVDWDSE